MSLTQSQRDRLRAVFIANGVNRAFVDYEDSGEVLFVVPESETPNAGLQSLVEAVKTVLPHRKIFVIVSEPRPGASSLLS